MLKGRIFGIDQQYFLGDQEILLLLLLLLLLIIILIYICPCNGAENAASKYNSCS
jgi:hypothetical protein